MKTPKDLLKITEEYSGVTVIREFKGGECISLKSVLKNDSTF